MRHGLWSAHAPEGTPAGIMYARIDYERAKLLLVTCFMLISTFDVGVEIRGSDNDILPSAGISSDSRERCKRSGEDGVDGGK